MRHQSCPLRTMEATGGMEFVPYALHQPSVPTSKRQAPRASSSCTPRTKRAAQNTDSRCAKTHDGVMYAERCCARFGTRYRAHSMHTGTSAKDCGPRGWPIVADTRYACMHRCETRWLTLSSVQRTAEARRSRLHRDNNPMQAWSPDVGGLTDLGRPGIDFPKDLKKCWRQGRRTLEM